MDESIDDQLVRHDRLWEREREQYLIAGRRPSGAAATVAGILAVGIGVALTYVGLAMVGQASAGMFGPLLILSGGLIFVFGRQKAKQYRRARDRYLAERERILSNDPTGKS